MSYFLQALVNFEIIDSSQKLNYKNLRLIRSFEGLDDEAGFTLTHVNIAYKFAKVITIIKDITSIYLN